MHPYWLLLKKKLKSGANKILHKHHCGTQGKKKSAWLFASRDSNSQNYRYNMIFIFRQLVFSIYSVSTSHLKSCFTQMTKRKEKKTLYFLPAVFVLQLNLSFSTPDHEPRLRFKSGWGYLLDFILYVSSSRLFLIPLYYL